MKKLIIENRKLALQYLKSGKISEEDFKKLFDIDPTEQKKYLGWLTKIWVNERPNFSNLKNTVEEYDVFVKNGKTEIKDINQFKTFNDLFKEVDRINKTGNKTSSRKLEREYEVITDNENIIVISPHTHEASRKLGLSVFAYRDCEERPGTKDSAWCTTYSAPDHFNSYYFKDGYTFYYIRFKKDEILKMLSKEFYEYSLEVAALVATPNGDMRIWDALDNEIKDEDIIKKFTDIVNKLS